MIPLLVPMHGIGSRRDLPLPFEYVLAGAALALLISFAVLALAWRRPRWTGPPTGIALPGLTRFLDAGGVRVVARTAALLLWGVAGFALVAGEDLITNPVFGFVFAWLWVGLVPLSLLFGPAYRYLNPVRTLYAAVVALLPTDPRRRQKSLPAWVGIWPAAAGLAAFAWLELVQPGNNTLAVLRGWALVWLVGLAAGAVRWGEDWIAAADPFEAYASLVARLAPWRRTSGVVHLVNPLRNLVAGPTAPGTAGAVSVLLGSTAFDSFSATTTWVRWVQDGPVPAVLAGSVGLLVGIALVANTFELGVRGMKRHLTGPETSTDAGGVVALRDAMAASVVPIVVGYALGHYLSLFVVEGQRTAIQFSDPLGLGWNLFGTAELGIWMAWLDYPTAVALFQLAAIVLGHLLGVLVAHELAIRRLRAGGTVLGQLPLLLVMVGYTLGGLVLLFSP